jgi:Ca2+-binding RTX toxin-like protein
MYAIRPMIDRPVLVANDDKAVVRPGTTTAIDPLANDSHAKDSPLRLVEVSGVDGVKVWVENNVVFFHAPEGREGVFEMSYVVESEDGFQAKAVLHVTVDPTLEEPKTFAQDDVFAVPHDTIVKLDLTANDTFADGKPTGVAKIEQIDGVKLWIEDGVVYAYVPADRTEPVTFAYAIVDGNGVASEAKATLTFDVKEEAATQAKDDAFVVQADTIVQLDLTANDRFAYDKVTGVAKVGEVDGVKLWVENGVAYAYVPKGRTEPVVFTYAIVDADGVVSEAQATLTLEKPEEPETVAHDDTFKVRVDQTIQLDVKANDVLADGDILAVEKVGGDDGVKLWIENGVIHAYVPDGHTDPVVFTYQVAGANGQVASATATLNIDTSVLDVIGTVAADALDGTRHGEVIQGLSGRDTINALGGNDTIDAGNGHDTVWAGAGDDEVTGGNGWDVLHGEEGADVILGGNGHDTMDGGLDNDRLFGGTGHDSLLGSDGDDSLDGGVGNDTLSGGAGADTLEGQVGADRLWGDEGNDALHGGAGKDVLTGGLGDDRLVGGRGTDTLDGGEGADTFVWQAWNDSGTGRGADVIRGFEVGVDKLDVSALFTDVEATWIGSDRFSRTEGEVRYDERSGMLWFDRDGNGVRDMAIAFEPGVALTADDFLF